MTQSSCGQLTGARGMLYGSYRINITEETEFDVAFRSFVRRNHRGAARLLQALKLFAKAPEENGGFVRQNESVAIYVIPRCIGAFDPGEAYLFARIELFAIADDGTKSIEPLRFVDPVERPEWAIFVRWAERLLGI